MLKAQALADRLARIERRRLRAGSEPVDRTPWEWYAPSCPCGLPAGECLEHARARPAQRPPAGAYRNWFLMGGRGAGKTRAGAEMVRYWVETGQASRVALIGPTAADCRDVMVEGPSGILETAAPWFRPKYQPARRKLTWPNGCVGFTYSSVEPNRLRGPQHSHAWCDEIGAWVYASTFSMLMLGLRLGSDPRSVITSTPRAIPLVKDLVSAENTRTTRARTQDNAPHLAPEFLTEIVSRYVGTRFYDQEVSGELIALTEGAWFPQFSRARHVSTEADWNRFYPTKMAVDCGTSRFTGAVLYQVVPLDRERVRFHVFGDYLSEGLFSEANAVALAELVKTLCLGDLDRVLLDPAASARTGLGPSAESSYERVFPRIVTRWPLAPVLDGLDQVEILLGSDTREPEILIHPRARALIEALETYRRARRGDEYLDLPVDPQHPAEDLVDPLRGAVVDHFPNGRRPPSNFRRVRPRDVF